MFDEYPLIALKLELLLCQALGKYLSFILIAIFIASSLLMIKSANAQTIPKPSVPEFTAEFVIRSYDVPVTYENVTDPFTGQVQLRKSGGYHVDNKTIDITITNQPFTSTDIDGNKTHLYYVIRWKGQFDNWADINYSSGNLDSSPNQGNIRIEPSDSDFTFRSFRLIWDLPYIPEGGSLDFQVKAQVGYSYQYYGGHIIPIGTNFQVVEESEWSTTQTVTIPASSTSPTSSPSVSEFSYLTILPILLTIPIALAMVRKRLQRNV
jgi:hypothetical protein